MDTRIIVIEVTGGVVVNVHGLPDNFVYEVADWDDAENGDVSEKAITEQIVKANSLQNLSIKSSYRA